MPNIELHGYAPDDVVNVRNKIHEVLRTSTIADEIVTTLIGSNVQDLKGDRKPFLRVISGHSELDELKELLKPLGQDIEVLVLSEWIPKE